MTFENDAPPPRKPRVFKPGDIVVEAESDDVARSSGAVTARRAARVPSRHLTVTDINRGFRFGSILLSAIAALASLSSPLRIRVTIAARSPARDSCAPAPPR